MLFNFYSHPSLYIRMTLLKVVSYWQMWQRFSNKSWAKAVAPSAPDMILDNWISLAVHMLSWHHEKTNKKTKTFQPSLCFGASTADPQRVLSYLQILLP